MEKAAEVFFNPGRPPCLSAKAVAPNNHLGCHLPPQLPGLLTVSFIEPYSATHRIAQYGTMRYANLMELLDQ